ncbi:MAG TPA: hypothetical protein VFK32_05845 [Tepidiformaceae bacterium]|nr:hypothetical protein [Tepidiformaceae bacterium]
MDIDLFQGILLGLLAIGLVVLIALLATLGGIRKALERGSATAVAPVNSGTQPTPAEAPERVEPVAAAAAVTPTDQEPEGVPEAQPAASTQADTIRAVLSQHGVQPSTATAATPAAEPASVVAAHIDTDEPEEEPFQRDGRWWFKRGGELLVYNEATAEWEPAERPTHWPAGGTTSSTAPVAAIAPSLASTATTAQAAVSSAGSGWKCPSCGAINGSTAASCRMCFTARP